ncbi:YggU family protein [Candidatus Parcubacteria bacterium]|nr:YggU family protein [Candidatus Parcubacteria bacterium]
MIEKFIKKLNKNSEIYLRLKINPGSAKNEIKDVMADETIKINISAPAEKGKANKELIKFLSNQFGVNKDEIKIISGAGDRLKLVKINKN